MCLEHLLVIVTDFDLFPGCVSGVKWLACLAMNSWPGFKPQSSALPTLLILPFKLVHKWTVRHGH